MFRITSTTTDGRHSGTWRVEDGDDHQPRRGDNLNRYFETKRAARARVRDLNR